MVFGFVEDEFTYVFRDAEGDGSRSGVVASSEVVLAFVVVGEDVGRVVFLEAYEDEFRRGGEDQAVDVGRGWQDEFGLVDEDVPVA